MLSSAVGIASVFALSYFVETNTNMMRRVLCSSSAGTPFCRLSTAAAATSTRGMFYGTTTKWIPPAMSPTAIRRYNGAPPLTTEQVEKMQREHKKPVSASNVESKIKTAAAKGKFVAKREVKTAKKKVARAADKTSVKATQAKARAK